MAGQRQKAPDDLINKWGGRYQALAPVAAPSIRTPACPREVGNEARKVWRTLWRSPLAGAFKDSDVPALRRWIWWLNEWQRAADMMRESEPVTRGANGPVLNPLARYLKLCETSLRELEKAFGMDALARLRLGLTLVEEQSAIAKLKQPVQPREISA